jgi:hypothetical protein
MNIQKIIKNPVTKALLVSPEVLIGLAVMVAIIYGVNEMVLNPMLKSGTEIDGKIASLKTDVDAKKQFLEAIKKLDVSGKEAYQAFLTVPNAELLSVTVFDFMGGIRRSIAANLLQLPAPHNTVAFVGLEQDDTSTEAAAATPATGGATDTTTTPKMDLHDVKNAPFKFDEAAILKDAQLSTYTINYTLKLKGTYAGLLSFLNAFLTQHKAISVNTLNFSLDDTAPLLTKLRAGANLLPPPVSMLEASTIPGSEGAASGSGGGTSVLSMGSGSFEEEKPATPATPSHIVPLPSSSAPVLMTLNFRLYIKEVPPNGTAVASAVPAVGGVASAPPADVMMAGSTAPPTTTPATP